ncbi:hypothetical protein BJX70DRAFT_67655 [Aspergillus crustosus]
MPAQEHNRVSGSQTDHLPTKQTIWDQFKSPPRLAGCHVVLGYTRSGSLPTIAFPPNTLHYDKGSVLTPWFVLPANIAVQSVIELQMTSLPTGIPIDDCSVVAWMQLARDSRTVQGQPRTQPFRFWNALHDSRGMGVATNNLAYLVSTLPTGALRYQTEDSQGSQSRSFAT